METASLVLGFLVLLSLAVIVALVMVFLKLSKLSGPRNDNGESLVMLQNQLSEMRKTLDSKLSE